ncbi:unnamed protein product [Auanema sp. JU1783]|nr:unnamed protein product [Auanema sp. JU1783]
MEEVSTRRASLDDYGATTYGNGALSSSIMEATMHDVMTIEMSHHDVADSYLDPRSFGGLNSYEDYNGSHPSSYSTNSSTTSSSSTTSFESSTSSQTAKPSYSSAAQQTSSSAQSKFDNSTRFDSQLPPPSQRRVPTYPVKTANPATCTQYAPARTIITVKSTRRAQSRTAANKKETLDPQRLEDEVARNVSQIMSATKQQRLIQEAQIKNGIIPTTKAFFNCPECGKGMTSQRNLQRHRQSSCNKRFSQEASPVREDESSSNIMIDTDIQTPPLVALPGVDTFSQNIGGYNMVSEMNDWCSTESYSPVQSSQADHLTSPLDNSESLGIETASHVSDNCLPPLSLETDESRTHSSSASHCSSNSGGNSASQGLHTCGSCKKSVCSLRSLKRHFTTCKQFIADHGPPENDSKPKVKSRRKPKAGSDKENEVASLESMNWPVTSRDDEVLMMPSTSTSSLSALSSSSSSVSDSGSSASDVIAAVTDGSGTNVCVDCSRQLCSASNLKRHRATCKAALQNSRLGATSRCSSPSTPPSSTDEKDVPQQTVTRNSSTRFAEQRVTRQSQATAAANILLNDPELQQKPWITVGEHLRAQHHKAKLGDNNSRDVESAGSPTSCIANASTSCAVTLLTNGSIPKQTSGSKQPNNAVSTTTGLNNITSSQVAISSSNLRAATAKSRNNKNNNLNTTINNNNNNNNININNNGNVNASNSNNNNAKASNARVTYYKLDSMRPVIVAKPKSDAYGDTTTNSPKNNRLNTEKVSIDASKKNNNKKDDVVRSTDQTKKWKIAQVPLNGESAGKKKPLESIITTQPLSDERLAGLAEPMILPDNRTIHRAAYPGHDFQCPECKKNYSCRKNVKRHRMAVHKLTAEEVSQFPAVPCTSAVQVPNKLATLSTVAATTLAAGTRIPVKPQKISTKYEYQTEMIPLSPLNDKPMSVTFTMKPYPEDDDNNAWGRSSEYDEETAETARIAAELKRSAEQEVGEYLEKRPRTELAEADTTFSEEAEHSLVRSHHSSPGVHVSSSYGGEASSNAQSLPSISTWIDSSKPLTVDIPPLNATRSENSSPALRQRRQYSTDCTNRVASSEYGRRPQQYNSVSNERSSGTAPSSLFNENFKNKGMNSDDPLLGHNVLNSLSRADDDWFRNTEDTPDSTTSQRLKFVCVDRSTSPGHPDQGNSTMLLPMTRNRTSSGSSSNGATGYVSSDPKQARHLCQWRPGTTTNSAAHQHEAASKRPANDDSSNTYLWSSPPVPQSKASNHQLTQPSAIISDAMDLTTPDCMSFSIALAGLKTASSSSTSSTETNSCAAHPPIKFFTSCEALCDIVLCCTDFTSHSPLSNSQPPVNGTQLTN